LRPLSTPAAETAASLQCRLSNCGVEIFVSSVHGAALNVSAREAPK
jgi:hypothetical protein